MSKLRKNCIFLLFVYFSNLIFAREAHFEREVESIKSIRNGIIFQNKTKSDVSVEVRLMLLCFDYSRPELRYKTILNAKLNANEKKSFSTDITEESIMFDSYSNIKLLCENENITYEIKNSSKGLTIVITDLPTYEQLQKYPRYNSGWDGTIDVSIEDGRTYSVNALFFMSQKNDYSEALSRYVCFYDYELGKGEKGSPQYIKYKRTLLCEPYFTIEQRTAVEEKVKLIYQKNVEHYSRVKENIEINQNDLNYHINDFEKISFFSRNHIVGKKYLDRNLNYYDVRPMGDGNYDIAGKYDRAVFHSNTGLSHFTMTDYQRVLTYLGNIDVVRNDGVKLSLPYYECSEELPAIDNDISMIISRGFDWQWDVELTDEARKILKK